MIRPAETSGPGLLLLPAGNQPVISRNNLFTINLYRIPSLSALNRKGRERIALNKLLIFLKINKLINDYMDLIN